MALPRRERLRICIGLLAFIAILPACNARRSQTIDVEVTPRVPNWAEKQGFADNADAIDGAKIFAQVGCIQCHTYLGSGTSNLGAPDLSEIGNGPNRGADDFASYVADPSKFGNNLMPKFADLGEKNLSKVGAFLEASKGPK